VLVADDERSMRELLAIVLKREGYDVVLAENGGAALAVLKQGHVDLLISDIKMPDMSGVEVLRAAKAADAAVPAIMMTAFASTETAVEAMRLGACDYLVKPFDVDELKLKVREKLEARQLRQENVLLKRALNKPVVMAGIIGSSSTMLSVFELIESVAKTTSTVLVTGESGTGKELVAKALHDFGKRKGGPFVAVNMAAIPRELIESELFGHEKGAFTGAAARRLGRFEQAEGGTLFLDEIGDMPLEAQTRLLRVLQQGEFVPVGGHHAVRANVRIVAASHRDLRLLVGQGGFREDLFYRLNVVPIRLPALRERVDDIPALVQLFLAKGGGDGLPMKTLTPEAMGRLKSHAWPGNVRELENLVRRLAVLYAEDTLGEDVIALELEQARPQAPAAEAEADDSLGGAVERYLERYFRAHAGGLPPPGVYDRLLREIERPLILRTLSATRGNQLKAADILGLNRNTLRKKIRDLDIPLTRAP
jgi:two-component system nitrogen regulation response regulator GlnG